MTISELIERLRDCKRSGAEQAMVYIDNDLFYPVEDIVIKYGHVVIQCKNIKEIKSE